MSGRRRVCVLGATGSIGAAALDVMARHPQRFAVDSLAARADVDGMAGLCALHRPARVCMDDPDAAEALRARLARDLGGDAPGVLQGGAGQAELLQGADTVVAGVSGMAGLPGVLAAAEAGCRILLANKEPLVVAGELLLRRVRDSGAEILPLDSEHQAAYQCLGGRISADGQPLEGVRGLVLTATGGPFYGFSASQLAKVRPEQAVAHPVWDMGAKISVDSATLMNKGLEVMEAAVLFGLPVERIEVVIHRAAQLHAMVEFVDGFWLVQASPPDMRCPVAAALDWPRRHSSGVRRLDLAGLGRLEYERVRPGDFPALRLALQAGAEGGLAPCVLNAANEVAVDAFLHGRIGFCDIPATVEAVLGNYPGPLHPKDLDLQMLAEVDAQARGMAQAALPQGSQLTEGIAS